MMWPCISSDFITHTVSPSSSEIIQWGVMFYLYSLWFCVGSFQIKHFVLWIPSQFNSWKVLCRNWHMSRTITRLFSVFWVAFCWLFPVIQPLLTVCRSSSNTVNKIDIESFRIFSASTFRGTTISISIIASVNGPLLYFAYIWLVSKCRATICPYVCLGSVLHEL